MNQWSIERKRIIFSIVALALVTLIGAPLFFWLYDAPTCFDTKQNGDETGIDCGGSCRLLCTAESLPLVLNGDPRVLKVSENTFEVVVSVNNTNTLGEIYRAGYTFKVYEAQNTIPIKVIEGDTFVPKGATFAIFEGPFNLGEGVKPTRVTFEWKEDSLVWQKNVSPVPELKVEGLNLSREITSPHLDANITNLSLENVSNIDLIAIVSDESGNIYAASKTFIETLPAGKTAPLVFTWPEPFRETGNNICDYPADVSLVIDRSGSMNDLGLNPPQPLTDVKNTALYFISQFGKNIQHSLVSFANESSQPIDATLGFNLITIRQAVNDISIATTSAQNTNIGAGILSAREELNSLRHRKGTDKALVLLTDGVATLPDKAGVKDYPKTHALESAELAKKDGISIYTIGLGKNVDVDLLKRIATSTSEAYFAPSTNELNDIYQQIATKICKIGLAKINVYVRIFPDRSFLK
ncbi:MAG: hypothetical protein COV96_00935 [Candidatus Zambryskibacteria bacterium CG11_big_fil_rev_8_21_14_0_20_42_18]|uniref:VWFA domain-containing protein n=1 Tax=Candidatus Zambryskibacteria bacterium CG_4_9_14_3_um_filter_42_15 TaxID=1975112 RepID=A0A2M7WT12_9BACT|nr:MAG: hypothetical protein COV96_00935 [Candidatus Zambryskibacteria bacterium CG11_big_fil_rev_8_21_14_0_20_42_18]PJA33129.1 MAG: hypothetical protein CO185_00415 [Candidatus Zambryskibacteria bacterium CG_4_9_14_3_um_filter_42_15]